MMNKNHFIRKPGRSHKVVITESISPLAEVIETIPCGSAEAAWQTYRRLKKDQGKML